MLSWASERIVEINHHLGKYERYDTNDFVQLGAKEGSGSHHITSREPQVVLGIKGVWSWNGRHTLNERSGATLLQPRRRYHGDVSLGAHCGAVQKVGHPGDELADPFAGGRRGVQVRGLHARGCTGTWFYGTFIRTINHWSIRNVCRW